MQPTICQAIRECRVLELRYHGWSRLVEPHAYGLGRRGGERLLCYQIAGGSDSGERIGWKLLKPAEVVSLHLTQTSFAPRADYRGDVDAIAIVYCRVRADGASPSPASCR